jgi:mannose-1-phosphate guanylyltransferase/phosphomannomutase
MDGETALNVVTLLSLKRAKAEGTAGSIAVPVSASRAIEEMSGSYGFKTLRTKTSSRGIMEAATASEVFFVGEETGGFIFPEFQPVFDGMFAVAKILEMLAKEGKRLHRLVREIPSSVMIKDKVTCPWEKKGAVMRRLSEDARGEKTTLIDGIRINYGSDWILAYPSQSHPYFHIVAEASTEEKAKQLLSTYRDKIRNWQKTAESLHPAGGGR